VIYADMWAAIIDDVPPAVLFSLAATVIVVIFAFRGGRASLAVLSALLVGVAWMAGMPCPSALAPRRPPRPLGPLAIVAYTSGVNPADAVTLTLPHSMLPELPALARSLNDRMHALLERNTEGTLVETERAELETLVQVAQIVQILAMAAQGVKAA
jgi:hypothetical protein